ncbi:MAG: quinohemoprotein amine dehydrogenase subunit alpha [Rhodospirillaceae bacterium]|nr:quinohemoprotein amine dehydrogenase subunit alpha [Rhodospirillaceae bacterium]
MTLTLSVRSFLVAATAAGAWAGLASPSFAEDPEAILEARCGACHSEEEGGGLSRIYHQRKTPEGWLMTIVRMGIMHGVEVPPDERRALVKYLADSQGLAPSETEKYRYALERRPNVIESLDFDEDYPYMCGRCHSGARGALQRRTTEEWRLHVHFHLGQWPTTEYQFFGRDREWFKIATTETAEMLGKQFPFETAAWSDWQAHEDPDLSGTWRFVGHGAAMGSYEGTADLKATDGEDQYAMSLTARYADGTEEVLVGSAILYTGYEFRARLSGGEGGDMLMIGTVDENGNMGSGRAMLADADEIGSDYQAVRVASGTAAVLAVEPPFLKAGSKGTISIYGTGLSGDVSLGDGVTVVEVVSSEPGTVTVVAEAGADAMEGPRTVSVGGTDGGALTVYQNVDQVRVEPAFGIARVGGAGGPIDRVKATFEAVAYAAGADGEAGTEDDLRIGPMDAAWALKPFDEVAAELDDTKFAGTMDPKLGVFTPAAAGLNPERPFSTNNAGNLTVVGTVDDGGTAVSGEGQLIVTVQRWNDPPIR